MVYYNFGPHDFTEGLIQGELEANPGIQATAMPASYDDTSVASSDVIAAMVAENPDLGAIWTNEMMNDIFWGLSDLSDQYPAIICSARQDELQSWKDRTAEHPEFQCIASVKPGGNAYEAVYVAYYRLAGLEIDPAALGGEFGNTLLYDDSIITNDDLDEWLGKIGELRTNEWGGLELSPMTPEDIWIKWFLN
jgi:ABC-type sugar transport system substrate-binding protein